MWVINRIDEADYGCEERMPGEPLLCVVTLQNEYGMVMRFEVADNWLNNMGLDEGDEWPEELIADAEKINDSLIKQADWTNNYMDALDTYYNNDITDNNEGN